MRVHYADGDNGPVGTATRTGQYELSAPANPTTAGFTLKAPPMAASDANKRAPVNGIQIINQ